MLLVTLVTSSSMRSMILNQFSGVTVCVVQISAESAVGDFGVFIMVAVERSELSLHDEDSKCFS